MVEDSIGKAMMFESTRRRLQFYGLMDRFEELPFEDVVKIVDSGVLNPEKKKALFLQIRTAMSKGATSPAEIPNIEWHIREEVGRSFQLVDKMGISALGSMVFDWNDGIDHWRIYNPDIIVANFKEGGFGRIAGLPGMGKTNLGCVMIEEWTKKGSGYTAISNILPEKGHKSYVYVESAKDFLTALTHIKGRWLFILDEGGLVYGRQDQTTRRVKDLDKLMRIVRKLHGNMVLVEQRIESVPALIQEFAQNLYYAHAPGIVTIDLRGPHLRAMVKVREFPRTQLPFDTYDVAYFATHGVDLQEVFGVITGEKDWKVALLNYLEEEKDTKGRKRKLTKADRIRELVQTEEDDNVIAGLIGSSKSYVASIRASQVAQTQKNSP